MFKKTFINILVLLAPSPLHLAQFYIKKSQIMLVLKGKYIKFTIIKIMNDKQLPLSIC